MEEHQPQQSNFVMKKKKSGVKNVVLLAIAGLAIFWIGVNIGSGDIAIGPDQVFRQSANEDLPDDLSYGEVEQVYDALRKNFAGQLSEEKLLEGLKHGLAGATGDTYTEYLSPDQAAEFEEDLNGTFSGIGAELSKEEQAIVVVSPIEGFPAQKAGLLPQDVISEIDGESAYDIGLTEAVNQIRGPEGTDVTLTIIRDGEEKEITITRAQITIPSVEYEILDGNIGYINVTRFADDTTQIVSQAADEFINADVDGVIMDVRNNPGGLLDQSVSLSGLWLEPGVKVLEEKRDGVSVKTYNSNGPGTLGGIPTVVLVNEGSASASEIVAGALRDNDAAILLGQKTFGKGSVQQLEPLGDGGVLKVTIARWFTPGGKNIDKDGIKPDQKVELTPEDLSNERDPQRDAAVEYLQNR